MDAFSLLAFVLALIALLLVIPLAFLFYFRKQELLVGPYLVVITEGREPTREVPINGSTTIFTEGFVGDILLLPGLGKAGNLITITNASPEGIVLRSDIIINAPPEYITEEGNILLPAKRTMNFVLQNKERAFFLGSYPV